MDNGNSSDLKGSIKRDLAMPCLEQGGNRDRGKWSSWQEKKNTGTWRTCAESKEMCACSLRPTKENEGHWPSARAPDSGGCVLAKAAGII